MVALVQGGIVRNVATTILEWMGDTSTLCSIFELDALP